MFLGFPGPPQTRYTPSFFISKKNQKFYGGYSTVLTVALRLATLKRKKLLANLTVSYYTSDTPWTYLNSHLKTLSFNVLIQKMY
jgi:hypothetical protein